MKIEENQSAVLSNHEVLSFIKTKQAKWAEQGRTDTVPRNVTRVLKNVSFPITSPPLPSLYMPKFFPHPTLH